MIPWPPQARSTREEWLRLLLLLIDGVAVALALVGAYVLRYHTRLAEPVPVPPVATILDTSYLLGGLTLVGLRVMGTGRIRQVFRPFELTCSVVLATLVAVMLFSALSLHAARFFHRLFEAYFAILVPPAIVAGRYAFDYVVKALGRRARGLAPRKLVFVGESPLTRAILRQIELHPELGYQVVAALPAGRAADPQLMSRLMETLRLGMADQILFAEAPGSYQDLVEIVALFRGTGAELKRLLDVTVAGVVLLVFLPLFGVIALAIKLDSPGPVFFKRRCLGWGGAAFDVLKFRSMVTDAHQILERTPELLEEYRRTLKVDVSNDARVTRVGRLLRRTSLDELPQLVNVIKGEMSLVGPRMLGDIELERYGEFRDKVLSIRPGITGLWQVNGRSATTFAERLAMDNEYIDRWSLGLDFRILLKTIPAVIRMHGAH